MRILFVHGWACDSKLWDPLVRVLTEADGNLRCERAEFGFFGERSVPSGHFEIAVGHSLGLLWLLEQTGLTFEKIVSIGGFSRFYCDREFRLGTHPRIISKMQLNLKSDVAAQVERFLTQSVGVSLRPERLAGIQQRKPNEDRLDWGLEALKSWDRREQWDQLGIAADDRLVIAAKHDPIVSAELTRACFCDDLIHWIPSDSHLLPLVEPCQCALLIQNLIRK